MPNDTRSGLKISGNRSDGGMNPPQSPDLNIIEAVWDHLDRERSKRQPTSKEELWDVLQEAWRTIPEDYLPFIVCLFISRFPSDGRFFKHCLSPLQTCNNLDFLKKKIDSHHGENDRKHESEDKLITYSKFSGQIKTVNVAVLWYAPIFPVSCLGFFL